MDYELVPVEGYEADCEGGGEGEEEGQEGGQGAEQGQGGDIQIYFSYYKQT